MAKRNSKKKTQGKTGVPHATEASKTAQYANPRHAGPTKAEQRLAARKADYIKGSQAQKQDKQGSRFDAGGFHCPGSFRK